MFPQYDVCGRHNLHSLASTHVFWGGIYFTQSKNNHSQNHQQKCPHNHPRFLPDDKLQNHWGDKVLFCSPTPHTGVHWSLWQRFVVMWLQQWHSNCQEARWVRGISVRVWRSASHHRRRRFDRKNWSTFLCSGGILQALSFWVSVAKFHFLIHATNRKWIISVATSM